MITVVVDGYAASDGSEGRGIGTFLRRIAGGLAERPDLSVKVLAEPAASVPAGAERVGFRHLAPRRLRNLEHDLRLPRVLSGRGDVFHSPAQHPPRSASMPWVQTLHDVTPLTWPHSQTASERRRWLRAGPRLRNAAWVATVSQFSAQEGVKHLGLEPGRIRVIPNGVDPEVFRPDPDGDTDALDPGPGYLLHVAAWGPHKGFAEAVSVVGELAERGLPHRLRLVGPRDSWMEAQIAAVVRAGPRPDRVDPAGFVADLPSVYRGAAAVIVTSRCEGFGLPAVEAMACGTPVVAFANSSLPEVVGDAGLLVPDGDVGAMARAVRSIVEEPGLREDLVGRGLAQAARFRWEDAVDRYAELFHEVAG